jgi:hypothetical protein
LASIFGFATVKVLLPRAAARRAGGGSAAGVLDEGARPGLEPAPRAAGFRDMAPESGIDFRMSFLDNEQGKNFKINLYDHGCGVAVADYDGDGHDDVLFLNQLGGNALYRNCGNGTFDDVTQRAGPLALADRVKVGAAFGDYDNDGDQDLYVTSTRGGNVLLENQGDRTFRDVTESAGVTLIAHSQTPAFFDFDNDGDLDLFVTNSARWTSDDFDEATRHYLGPSSLWDVISDPELVEHNVLFRNDGGGHFSIATESAGLEGNGWGGDVAVFDYDEDGRLDVVITNMFGLCHLFHNAGDGHFDDVTHETLKRTSMGAIGCKAFDFDNDGRLDLFIADMHSDMWLKPDQSRELVEPQMKYRHPLGPGGVSISSKIRFDWVAQLRLGYDFDALLFGNSLYRNEGDGTFSEVSDAAGMETWWPWGVAVGDFDNDGFEDAFLPSGMGYPFFPWLSCLLFNRGDGTFIDRAVESGIEPPREGEFLDVPIGGRRAARSSRCAATADFDGDGRLEIIVNNFNDRPYYFKNEFSGRHYVEFRLRGTTSNRDAIGAVVKLHVGERVMTRQVHCSGGYLSQSSKTLHFGLGDVERIDVAEIHWPSGLRQRIDAPATDQIHEITEPDAAPAK